MTGDPSLGTRSSATTRSSLVWCPASVCSQQSSGPGSISVNSTGAPGACSRAGATKRTSVRRSEGLSKSTYLGLRSSGERAKTRRGRPRSRAQAARSSGAGRKLGGACRPARAAHHQPADLRAPVMLADGVEAAQRCDEDREVEELREPHAEACPRGLTRARRRRRRPRARRGWFPAGAGSSPLITTMSPSGYIGQLRAVMSTTPRRGGERWTPGPASAAIAAHHGGGVGVSQPEQALGEWVVAAVEVAEHDEEVAACHRVGARRGDLQVGGVIVRAVPRRRPIGEGVDRVGLAGDDRCPAAPQNALLLAHLVPQTKARAHELAEQRRERA